MKDPTPSGQHALTADVEDYFHASAFSAIAPPASWGRYESRVERNTLKVLALLADLGVRATFFVLGWVAERFPSLVRAIREAGHDLGCHSYAHRLIYDQTPEEFREDTRRARAAIEDAAGIAVNVYRAPTFSVTRRSLWALEVLLECGFTIDSSIFPTRNHLYGISDAPRQPFYIRIQGADLLEFPLPVLDLAAFGVPVTGGVYLRLLPLQLQIAALRKLTKRSRPVVLYFHPWELDPDQPRLASAFGPKFYHYAGLRRTEGRLRHLLRTFRFGSLQDMNAASPAVYSIAARDSDRTFLRLSDQENAAALPLAEGRARHDVETPSGDMPRPAPPQ